MFPLICIIAIICLAPAAFLACYAFAQWESERWAKDLKRRLDEVRNA